MEKKNRQLLIAARLFLMKLTNQRNIVNKPLKKMMKILVIYVFFGCSTTIDHQILREKNHFLKAKKINAI